MVLRAIEGIRRGADKELKKCSTESTISKTCLRKIPKSVKISEDIAKLPSRRPARTTQGGFQADIRIVLGLELLELVKARGRVAPIRTKRIQMGQILTTRIQTGTSSRRLTSP